MKELIIKTTKRVEFVDVTAEIRKAIAEAGIKNGACVAYVPHTTAGITINENADPSVVRDINYALNRLVPDNWDYHHTEGNADAHVKSSLVGCSLYLIIENGSLRLGTWQGVYFCEFDGPRSRHIWLQFLSSD